MSVDAIALCYQIRTLDKGRLEQDWGEVDDSDLCHAIREAVCFQLEV